MTIPATTRKAGPFTGNGSTTAFPFTFKVFTTADVAVIVADADGIESTLILDSDYSVTLNSDQDATPGGTVTYPISGTPLPSTDKLSIKGDVDYEQGTDIPTGGDFNPVVLENALDSLSMQIQQVQEAVSRAAVVPITSAADAADLVADIALLASKIGNLDVIFTNMADITTVADDLNEPVSEINTVAGSIANVNTVGANIADVNAVAANETNVDTVAGISANVTTVAGIAANVTTVAGIAANVTSVAGNATNINAVAGNATNINAVNANKTNIDAAVANATNINAAVANETSIDTVAGIAANVTTVAGISAAVSTVATNAAAVSTVATNITDVQNAEENADAAIAAKDAALVAQAAAESARDATLAAYDSFDDRYLGAKVADPVLDNDGNPLAAGELYFNTISNSMKVYTGTLWVDSYADGNTLLAKAANLSDLANVSTARTNLGLGTAATTAASDYVAVTGDQTVAGVKTFTSKAVIEGLTVGKGAGSVATNTAVGASALAANTTGSENTAVGQGAAAANTTGNYNAVFGRNTFALNTTGSSNAAFGQAAMYANTTGANNTGLGYGALANNTTASNNTAVGYQAGHSNTTASENTAVGRHAMYTATTGDGNTAIGGRSGFNITSGRFNAFLGVESGYSVTTGQYNTFVGYDAGYYCTSGSGNIQMGANNSTGGYAPVFGLTAENNRVIMGHVGVTNAYVNVAWTVVSDLRDKIVLGNVPHGLDFVNGLNPIKYQFRESRNSDAANGSIKYGFGAQDVLALEGDEPVIVDAEVEDKLKITDSHLLPVLVKAIQELNAKVDAQAAQIAALKGQA